MAATIVTMSAGRSGRVAHSSTWRREQGIPPSALAPVWRLVGHLGAALRVCGGMSTYLTIHLSNPSVRRGFRGTAENAKTRICLVSPEEGLRGRREMALCIMLCQSRYMRHV